jgi:DNA-binding SARP family transcriptional activator
VNPVYRLQLLGEGVRLFRRDDPLRVDARAGLLLAYLALSGPTSRERVAGMLWPDGGEGRARGNLRQLILRLRRLAPILLDGPLRLAPDVVVDVALALEDPLAAPRAADLLVGVDASFSPPLEEWLDAERARFAHTLRARLLERVTAERETGRFDRAVAAARRALAFGVSSESAYRTLMEVQIEHGDVGGALDTFAHCRETLERLFDAEPSGRTVELGERAAALLAEQVRAAPLPAGVSVKPVADPADLARRAETGGWLREGAALLRITAATTTPSVERGRVLVNLAWLEHQLGDGAEATRAAEEGVALLRRFGDAARLVDGLFVLGSLARHRGEVERARAFWQEALAQLNLGLDARSDDRGLVLLHLNLGLVEDALHDPAAARGHYLAAMAAARPGRDDRALATVLNNLGHDRLVAERPEEARALLGRSMALARALDDRQLEGHVLDGLAQVEVAIGDPRRARAFASRAVELARELGDHALQVEALTTLSACWRALGDPAAAAAVARATLRSAWRQGYLPGVGRALLELAAALGDDDVEARALLRAVAIDERVSDAQRARARRSLGDVADGSDAPRLEDLLPVTLR